MYCAYNYSLKGAVLQNRSQYEKETSVVFSQQIDISGVRKFSILDQHQFAYQYATIVNRSFYEVLPPLKKKKIYMDIDIKRDETDITETGELVINFLRYSSAILQKIFSLDVYIEDWFILNSSTPSKASYHAVLNHPRIRFVDLSSMKKLIEYLIQSYENEVRTLDIKKGAGIKIIDLKVYHENQNLRMFLSSKLGRENVLNIDPRDLHILKLSSESMDDITIQVILASLITQTTLDPLVAEDTDSFKTVVGIENSSCFPKLVEVKYKANITEQNSQLQEFVRDKYGANVKYVNFKNDVLYVLLDPPLPCPYLGRVHSKNNTYIKIHLVNRSWTEFCHGSTCKNKTGVWTLLDPNLKFD